MAIIIFFLVILILMGAFAFGMLFISISHYNFKYCGKKHDPTAKNLVKKDFKVGILLIVISFVLVSGILNYLLSL